MNYLVLNEKKATCKSCGEIHPVFMQNHEPYIVYPEMVRFFVEDYELIPATFANLDYYSGIKPLD